MTQLASVAERRRPAPKRLAVFRREAPVGAAHDLRELLLDVSGAVVKMQRSRVAAPQLRGGSVA